jgi:hypothetical protein
MSRQVRRFIFEVVIKPPLTVIGSVVISLYWVLYGWWGERRFTAKEQGKLVQEIQEQFWFLFGERNGQIVANKDTGHLSKLKSPIVTVAVDGLLFRFIHWRDDRQVHVASERLPSEWHELSAVLNVMEPDKVLRHSVVFFQDAARLLRDHFDLVKGAFSPDRYSQLKEQLEHAYRYEMGVTRQVQDEINRGLSTL